MLSFVKTYDINIRCVYKNVKGKVRTRMGHEDPEGEQRCSSTLSLTSVLGEGVVNATIRPLYPWGKDPLPIL
jgi:hypothetical protein